MNNRFHVLAPLALSMTSTSFAATEPVKQPTEIVITASRSARQPSAQLSYTIDRDRIEQSTATTLPDLLRQVPGVQIRSLFGTASAEAIVDLGGMGPAASQNTLILIDGRRQNDIDSSAADIGGLALDQVERIEVLPGSGGVLYGEGAVGGVINIVTRNRELNRSEVKAGLGSYQTREGQILTHFSRPGLRGQVFLKDTQTDGYRQNGYVKRLEAGSKVERDLSNDLQIYGLLQASRQDQGFPGVRSVTSTDSQLQENPRGAGTPNDFGDTERLQGTAGLVKTLPGGARWITEGGIRHKNQKALLNGFNYLDTQLGTMSLNSRLERRNHVAGWQGSLVTGVDLSQSDYLSDRGIGVAMPPVHKLDIAASNSAAFFHQTLQKDTHKLTLGARATSAKTKADDRFFAENNPFADPDFPDAQAAPLRQRQTAKNVEMAFSEALTAFTTAGVAFARNTRLATVDDLFEGFGTSRSFSPLQPQVGRQFSAFIQHRLGQIELAASGFYHLLKNEIFFSNETFTNDNIDPTLRRGVSVSAFVPLTELTRLSANTTYQSATFREGRNRGNHVPLVARFIGNVNLTHDFTSNWQSALSVNYTGSRYFDNDDENSFGRKAPVMLRADASVRYRSDRWSVSATLLNLTNERSQFDYAASSGLPFGQAISFGTFTSVGRFNAYPLPERNLLVTATYRF